MSKRRSATIIALSALFLSFVLMVGPQDERTRMVFHQQYGHVTSGEKFGTRTGASWADADNAVHRLFKPSYVLWHTGTPEQLARGGGKMPDHPVLVGYAEVSYRDSSWRNGVITFKLLDGRVSEIVWHYPGPFYVDL